LIYNVSLEALALRFIFNIELDILELMILLINTNFFSVVS
jgi:hypothetical protein